MSYIVALEREIRPASLTRSRLGNLDLVIWRGASGKIHVWEDHCPHRSVKLSAGRNMGAYLEGVYHGWRFGEDGTVIHVPAEQGRAYPEISVNALHVAVTGGFVWADLGSVKPRAVKAGELLRPLHFLVPANTASKHVDADTFVTPWGMQACMVYGIGEDPRAAHAALSALRRSLEV